MKKTVALCLALILAFGCLQFSLADNLTPVEIDYLIDVAFQDFQERGIPDSAVFNMSFKLPDADGKQAMTFTLAGQECSYVFDTLKGEIVETNIPADILENAVNLRDFGQDTSTVVLSYIGYKSGGLDAPHGGKSLEEDGTIVDNYEFDYKGKHYSFRIDYLPGLYYYNDEIPMMHAVPTTSKKDFAGMEELNSDYLFDLFFEELGKLGSAVQAAATGIKLGTLDANGNKKYSFKIGKHDCYFLFNAFTGEVVDKSVPQAALASARDYYSEAREETIKTIDNYDGSADNFFFEKLEKSGVITVKIQFDYHGEVIKNEVEFPVETDEPEQKKSKDEIKQEAIDAVLASAKVPSDKAEKVKADIKTKDGVDFVTVSFKYGDYTISRIYVPSIKGFISDMNDKK